jgi:hypothetical protein
MDLVSGLDELLVRKEDHGRSKAAQEIITPGRGPGYASTIVVYALTDLAKAPTKVKPCFTKAQLIGPLGDRHTVNASCYENRCG